MANFQEKEEGFFEDRRDPLPFQQRKAALSNKVYVGKSSCSLKTSLSFGEGIMGEESMGRIMLQEGKCMELEDAVFVSTLKHFSQFINALVVKKNVIFCQGGPGCNTEYSY